MASYDVKALFTSFPMDPSIQIVEAKITTGPHITQQDQHVHSTHHHTTGVLP